MLTQPCVYGGSYISIGYLNVNASLKFTLGLYYIVETVCIILSYFIFSIGHQVVVEYHSDATYSLTIGDSTFLSKAHLRKDKESYIVHGNLGDSFFTANVAIIDRTMHIFSGEQNYTVTLPLPEFFKNLEDKQVGGAKTPAYSSRVTKVSKN